jgi:hypothetical protein
VRDHEAEPVDADREEQHRESSRATCSQKMRSRISGPNARRARAAEVATSTKVQSGSAHANSATAVARVARSAGAAEIQTRSRARPG